MIDVYDKIAEAKKKNLELALCVVVATKGSTPREMGAKMLVYADGRIEGTIGGGDLEKRVTEEALNALKTNKPATYRHELMQQHNMCCGGTVEVYIEPMMKKNRLYIFGAGHTGHALARYAVDLDFDVVVIDDRKEYMDEIKTPGISKLTNDYRQVLPALPFDDRTYIVIMTYSHPFDRDILAFCMKKPHAYLGMIGSRRKVEITKKMFESGMIASQDEMDAVDMPLGIDIGAEGPEEIAISVIAKLIAVKNKTETTCIK